MGADPAVVTLSPSHGGEGFGGETQKVLCASPPDPADAQTLLHLQKSSSQRCLQAMQGLNGSSLSHGS